MADGTSELDNLSRVQQAAMEALAQAGDEQGLAAWKTAHMGRSSAVMQVFSRLPQVEKDLRPALGQAANRVKMALEEAFNQRSLEVRERSLEHSLSSQKLDVTLPGRRPVPGRLHPSTQILREIRHIWAEMGFQVYLAPDVETEENNFELLNIPAYHPARDMQDTFHTTRSGVLLRTHTSPGQIRLMQAHAPEPIRAILPGMCYRYEPVSARHEVQFNQVEGIMVGHHVTLGDLKGTLTDFARRMFGAQVRTRLRPSYFPFTEPSGEMDIECFVCGGKGCTVCKSSGWLEILGCGMIHPVVLQNGGYDPSVFSGFAFGMGPERIAMLKYRIDDIRNFWANDVRFLEQF